MARRLLRRLPGITLAIAISCAAGWSGVVAAEADPALKARLLARTQAVFVAARARFEREPTNHVAAWEFARAGFDRAEFATNDTERAAIAVACIDACRKLIARDPKSVPGHYYLGMNLGQLARTKLLGALRIVDEMEREFKAAAALDERFAHAGPHRYLGSLYYEAPVIGSIGSRTKARKHLERAVELAPDYPENRLNLAEAFLKWREKNLLRRELEALDKLWPTAQKSLAGDEWEGAWADWQRRKDKLIAQANELLNR